MWEVGLRGDIVEVGFAGESVVVVESDKADMDVETFYDGFLAKIVIAEGETAPVGAAIGLLAETEEEIAEAKAKGGNAAAPAAAKPSSPVEEKAVAPPAPAAAPAAVAAVQVEPEPARSGRIVATPYAKKLAKQFNVDLAAVAGSGPSGRITATDVEVAAGKSPAPAAAPAAAAAVAAPAPAPTAAAPAAPAPASAPVPAGSVVFTSMQAGVARNMVDSLTVPTFHVGYTITTDALDALYKKVSDLLLFYVYESAPCYAHIRS
jgi:pyruvate dehydrogenase E2 component (dihydrolipoamide acetyltransferase)